MTPLVKHVPPQQLLLCEPERFCKYLYRIRNLRQISLRVANVLPVVSYCILSPLSDMHSVLQFVLCLPQIECATWALPPAEIDRINILQATMVAMEQVMLILLAALQTSRRPK